MVKSLAGIAPLSLGALILLPIFGGILRLAVCRRLSPAERERRRRLEVNTKGRMTGAMVLEIQDDMLHYSYDVGGAAFQAAQDISALRNLLPEPAAGPALAKYLPSNPANSIVVCESWSGLLRRKGAAAG